jgi:hypothetical protein
MDKSVKSGKASQCNSLLAIESYEQRFYYAVAEMLGCVDSGDSWAEHLIQRSRTTPPLRSIVGFVQKLLSLKVECK